MSFECTDKIIIENLRDGELINHSILLIKGRVIKYCLNVDQISLQVHTATKTKEIIKATRISHVGDFKILLNLKDLEEELKSDEFQLTFNFCNSSPNKLRIIFKENSSAYAIQPLYIVCQNEEKSKDALKEACGIIDLNLRLVQSVYADKIRAAHDERLTFALNDNCKVFESHMSCEEAWQLNENKLWQFFAHELLNSSLCSNERLKFVAFIACTRYDGAAVAASKDYSYVNIRKHLQGHAALGSGGLALFGSAFFYAWPRQFHEIELCFTNETKVDLATVPDESNYRRTWCGVYASTLGAICHEMGHIFNLGHTREGVMGIGFDYLNRVFTIESRTEDLPDRVLENKVLQSHQRQTHPGLTKLNREPNSFLDKYRKQRLNDSFYFPSNCAVILCYNKWFQESVDDGVCPTNDAETVTFDDATGVVFSRVHQLILVELRTVDNSLVQSFWMFLDKKDVYEFKLSVEVLAFVQRGTHYIFVLNSKGQIKRFPKENDKD